MQNLKSREDLARTIRVWRLEDVKLGSDVFGEVLAEAYLQDSIPSHKGKEIPLGSYNGKMFESLIGLKESFDNGDLKIEEAVDLAIKIITDPENYS